MEHNRLATAITDVAAPATAAPMPVTRNGGAAPVGAVVVGQDVTVTAPDEPGALTLAGLARLHGTPLDCIVAEMNDPFKQADDSMDSFVRAMIWDGWGYRRLDVPYVQPALSKDKAAVDGLLLIAKPCREEFERGLPSAKVKAILRGYMRWAMRIERPEATPEYETMSRYLDALESVPMASLGAFTGRDAARPLDIHEIGGPSDSQLAAGLAIYARAFPGGPTDVALADFRKALSYRESSRESHYHFWSIRAARDAPVEGMASFFSFPQAGFGGYIALDGSLRRTGRFPLLLARIDGQAAVDQMRAVLDLLQLALDDADQAVQVG